MEYLKRQNVENFNSLANKETQRKIQIMSIKTMGKGNVIRRFQNIGMLESNKGRIRTVMGFGKISF